MRAALGWLMGMAVAVTAAADEVTVQNDSLNNGSDGVIVTGFAAGEGAAAWLTSPCDGAVVAAQIFWLSQSGGTGTTLGNTIIVYRSGDFPDPGAPAAEIDGPVLTDGVINEYRYLDENNTVPLIVPVTENETFVVAFTFLDPPPNLIGPSLVRDTNGITPGANALYGDIGLGLQWYDAADLNITGDWVIRAVVDCQTVSTDADVSVALSADPAQYTPGAALTYTLTVANAGPAAAANTTVVDAFPAAYTGVSWTCAASGGASCEASGSGTIAGNVSLPSGGEVVYTVTGTVAPGTTGVLTNSATAVVGAPATDPDATNNTASIDTDEASDDDLIFSDGFDPP